MALPATALAAASTALAVAAGLAACGGTGGGASTGPPAARDGGATAAASGPRRAAPLIGVSFDVDNPIRRGELRALRDTAQLRGARLHVVSAAGDARAQDAQITRLLEIDRVDAIIAIAQDRRAILPAIRRANARGTPWVAFDRSPAPDPGSDLAAEVTGDPDADGKAAARALQALGRPLRVLHLWGALNDENALGRREGFNAQTARGVVRVVEQARTEWVPRRAGAATVRAVTRDPTIDAIFVPSDFLLPAVLGGLRRLRRLKPEGHPQHIHIITVDGDPIGCEALRQRYVDADVATPVDELGRRALDAAVTAIKRPDAPQLIVTLPGTIVTRADRRRAWGCRAR